MPWVVKIVVEPTMKRYRANYFPRKLTLKKDAVELQREVARNNGTAIIERDLSAPKPKKNPGARSS